MNATLMRWSLVLVALLTLMLCANDANAQRRRTNPPNQQLGGQQNGAQADFGMNNSRPGSNADAEKATRTVTGGMIAMGVMSLLVGLAIFGCLGFLIVQTNNHSAPGNTTRRRPRR